MHPDAKIPRKTQNRPYGGGLKPQNETENLNQSSKTDSSAIETSSSETACGVGDMGL